MNAPTFPHRLDFARLPTPIVPLERLSAAWGGPTIWVKRDDDTGATLTGNKIRKLQYAVAEAMTEGADTLVTCGGRQSNHCRATAILARQLGLDVVLMLRGHDPDDRTGNHLLDRLLGAEIRYVTPEVYAERSRVLLEIADELRASGRVPWIIDEGCSMPAGSWGYIECVREIAEQQAQFGVQFGTIVHAVGSGGTSAGLELGTRLFGLPARVLGFAVCDSRAYFQAHIEKLITATARRYGLAVTVQASELAIDDSSVGAGYGQTRPEELATLVEVARLEGLVLDPVYTGKAMHGLKQAIAAGRFQPTDHVLFLHTGGVFGLFPHADRLPL